MFNGLAFITQKIKEMTISSKEKYYNNLRSKLDSLRTYCKTYWSKLKALVNGRRMPLIPTIKTRDIFITIFTEKATL